MTMTTPDSTGFAPWDPEHPVDTSDSLDQADKAVPPPRPNLPNLDPQLESELVGHIRTLFFRARDHRRALIQKWEFWYRMAHIISSGRSTAQAATEVPEILPVLDAIVSWTTDQSPTFHIAPAVPPLNPWYEHYSTLAQDLETVVRSTWQVDKFDSEIQQATFDAYTFGIGYLKTVWDQTAYKGYGNAVMRRVDPFTMYPDPDATSPKNVNHLLEVRTVSRQECERRFPGSLELLAAGGWVEDAARQPMQTDAASHARTPTANPAALPGGTGAWTGPMTDTHVSDDPGVTLIEAWLRVPVEVESDDPATDAGDPDAYPNTRCYDSWRCIVVAGNHVLMDAMADELWSHGQHPYDRLVTMETGDWYGQSMVELLAPMQVAINEIVKSVRNNINLMGNPVMVDTVRSGIARTRVTNRPGERLTVNNAAATDVNWLNPPQIAPQMSNDLVAWYVQEMDKVSGLSAVVRGATPSGRNAQGVIDSMQEAAFVRIRKTIRNLSGTIGGAGEKLCSLITEFYDEPRFVTLLSTSGQQDAIFLQSHHFYMPDDDNSRVPMRYSLLVDAGDSQAQSRGQRIAEGDQLFALGAIDGESLLEIHSFPNWQIVADRVKQQQAMAGTVGQPPTQRAAARH